MAILRMTQAEQRKMVSAARMLFAKQLAFFSFVSIVLFHILVLYFPDAAAKRISPATLAKFWHTSPFLDESVRVGGLTVTSWNGVCACILVLTPPHFAIFSQRHAAWLAARSAAAAAAGHEEL
jgi:hypothetical protein